MAAIKAQFETPYGLLSWLEMNRANMKKAAAIWREILFQYPARKTK